MTSQWSVLRRSVDRLLDEVSTTGHPLPPPEMCELLVLGEDHRFWSHRGVDFWALCRAIFQTFVLASPQGGSTIAMQLVRTLTRRYDRTLSRKVLEIALAIRMTNYVGQSRIPVLYLWVAYYGWRMNNFRQACDRLGMINSSTDRITLAGMVARLKYPQPQRASEARLEVINRRARYLVHLQERNIRKLPRQVWSRFGYQARSST